MQALPFVSLLFYIIIIVCKASASCPCHIPCTGSFEVCTCYGPCGDDGYGCQTNQVDVNSDEYEFLDQVQCGEGQWQVQCVRTAQCSPHTTLDDTNPYAAYELDAQKNNYLAQDSFDDDDDEISDNTITSSVAKLSWFGGNWFDFWGQNDAQFFSQENMEKNNAENMQQQNIKAKYDNDISIDNQDYDSLASSQSAQRTLQNSKTASSKPILDDLGRNEAGYKIIALPLYILIICIVSSSILGMLMCAGFVYCGLNCCCPLPPQSPTLTSIQRHDIRLLQSLTLGGGNKTYYNNQHSVYHRMRNALHNPTADEVSLNSSQDDMNHDDEYVDSEDDNDEKTNIITRGNIDEMEQKDFGNYNTEAIESFALIGKCESDIDKDSDDSMIRQLGNLIETRLLNDNLNNINEDMDGMVSIDDDYEEEQEEEVEEYENEYNDHEPEIDETENEGIPLINNNNNDSGNNSGSKNSNLP